MPILKIVLSTYCQPSIASSLIIIIESDGPERAPTTGISQYGALLPGTVRQKYHCHTKFPSSSPVWVR